MITYELAKQLKDAGFPQKKHFNGVGRIDFYDVKGNDVTFYARPTLEELIEACGNSFKCLRNFRHEMWVAHGRTDGDRQFNSGWPGGREWVAEAVETYTGNEGTTGPISAKGASMNEAVARLWLALNTK